MRKNFPKLPLPSETSEQDALRLSAAFEKAARMEAEKTLLELRLQLAQVEANAIRDEVWKKYKLGPSDTVITETRQIKRAG